MNLYIVITSRHTVALLVLLMALSILSWWVGPASLVFDFNPFRARTQLGYPEICGVIAAGTAAAMLRPRFWEWERVASARASWLAAGYAVAGTVAPLGVVAVGALLRAPGADLNFMLSNVVVMSAVVFLLAPIVGPVIAGPVTLGLYLGHGLVNNLWFDTALLPITRYPDRQTHWTAAIGLILIAATVHFRTRGATSWAQRTYARDE